MKIIFISDIHANVIAFEQVLAGIKKEKPDQIIFLGDASTLGIRPVETLDLLQSLGCPCIMGNHDEFMIEPRKIHQYTKDKLVLDTVEWSRALHNERNIEFIKTFQEHLLIQASPYIRIFCYHGSPVSNMENVRPDTGLDSFNGLIGSKPDTVFIGGHTHVQMLRNVHGTRIVTSGSLGQPFVGYEMPPTKHPWAEYTAITVSGKTYSIELRQEEVDIDLINKEIRASNSPMNTFISENW